ncbi:hypothetical protein [Methylobacterium sp. WL18]|uniref:hypothetical protein n=1 Tax=Methylobacterium sp. WL18 TaxID=2603897 RepID=UPI00164F4786|nr:hypothetical protein [Methylobacterium sp. WL18]
MAMPTLAGGLSTALARLGFAGVFFFVGVLSGMTGQATLLFRGSSSHFTRSLLGSPAVAFLQPSADFFAD